MALLITPLLALHLVAVNVASAAPLVCIWLGARRRRGDETADAVGRQLAWASLWALLVGIALGAVLVALAWLDQSSGFWQAASRFAPRELWFAGAELIFSAVCLSLYAGMWHRWANRPWLHGLLAVASSTNLLYHFPPLMTVLGELAARPRIADEQTITHDVYRQLMLRPEVLAQVAHFAVAAVAFAGWALMWVADKGRESRDKSREPEGAGTSYSALISAGAWIALAASLAQLAVGLLVLVELPIARRGLLLGSDLLSAGLFFVAIMATFALLHVLATVALGDTDRATIRRSSLLMLAVVLLMTGTLVRVRSLGPGDPRIRLRMSATERSETEEPTQPVPTFTASAAALRPWLPPDRPARL